VIGILRRHQWRLLAAVVLVPLAAAIALHATTPLYTATGTLLYDPPAYRLAELQSILRVDPITEDVMASQAALLRGLKIVERVSNQLNLFDNPAFNHSLRPPTLPGRIMGYLAAWLAPTPMPAATVPAPALPVLAAPAGLQGTNPGARSGTNARTNTNVRTNTGTRANPDARANNNTTAGAGARINIGTYANTYTNTGSNTDSNGHANTGSDTAADTSSNTGTETSTSSDTRTSANTSSATDGNARANARTAPGTDSNGKPADNPGDSMAGPRIDDARNAVLLTVQAAIGTSTVRASRVITVTFTATDRVLAAAAVNMVMDVYIKDQLGAKYRAVRKANDWLDARVAELRAQVRANEDKIAAYRAGHGMIQGMHAGLDAEQVTHLSESLETARADLATAGARLDAVRGRAGAAAVAAIAPSVVQLRAQSESLRAQYEGLDTKLGPNHPDVITLRRQIADTDRAVAAETARVVAATQADAHAASDRVAALDADLHTARAAVDSTAQAQIPLDSLQRDTDAQRVLLQSVLGSIQDTAQQSAVESPDAHEISLALPPTSPSSPRVVQIMAGASAFGLMLGLLLVYVAEVNDHTLRSGGDVRAMLGLPCFALIPEISRRRLGRMPIAAYAAMKPMSQFAEQLRALRTGLWSGGARPRVVAVTAASPAEGKTSVTLALGRMAALAGERVCALDCDVRQPAFGRLLEADGELGLTDLLAGHATEEDVLRQDALSGMHYIAAGSAEANAFSLFMSEAMARLLQQLQEKFDLVLLDAPPAQAMTDTRIIAGIADATLLCLRWRATPLAVAENALALLSEAGANVVGAVLTRVDTRVHLRSGSADAEVYHPRYGGYFRG
jgi:polysaccharide biosynthesis transport protein